MKTRYRIKCSTADQVELFLNEIATFDNDIDLIIDSTTYDAKSLIVVNALSSGRTVEIELLGSTNELKRFDEFMKNFKD